tara:strand:- start:1676 stop:2113 length:438 start_codon:yes stop_codon:yes gene_type:complete
MRLSAQIKTELTNRLRDNADKLISGLNKKHSKEIKPLKELYEKLQRAKESVNAIDKLYNDALKELNDSHGYSFLMVTDADQYYQVKYIEDDVTFVTKPTWHFNNLEEKIKMDCDYHMTNYKPKLHGPVDLDIVYNKLAETYLPKI